LFEAVKDQVREEVFPGAFRTKAGLLEVYPEIAGRNIEWKYPEL